MDNKNKKSDKVKTVITSLLGLKTVNDNQYVVGELKRMAERMNDEIFRIAVVGEFSSGKSTFINALIGKDILSHARRETTAAITYIRNVSASDSNCGKVIIEFRDGSQKMLDDFAQIKDYTTAQSDNSVAEKIKSVTVYVNFLGSDAPILVVDTPGLNGIAKHHREITIEEMKKAHTCIYLLSSTGISKSDVDFIRILNDYQSTFLFLQNFIDDLSLSEGDSAESKTREDDRIIRESILGEEKTFNYKVIGISALKALASKDRSITKLYSKDYRELTDADRPRLYKESNFSELEQHLRRLIETEEYKSVIVDSVKRRLTIVLEGLLGQLDEEQKFNIQMREQDEGTKRINVAKAIIEKMDNTVGDRERKLRNFIKSTSDKQQMLLEKDMKVKINSLYDEICKDIDDKIPDYQSFKDFMKNYDMSPPRYYGEMISEKINYDIIPEIKDTANLFLNHIYELAIERIESYSNVAVRTTKKSFNVGELTESFQMEETESISNIESMEYKCKNLKNSIDLLRRKNADREKNLSAAKEVEQRINGMISDFNYEKQRAVSSLGSRPEALEWKTSKTVWVSRGGPIRDRIFGKIEKTVYDYHTDDSAGEEWDKRIREKLDEFRPKERELNNLLSDARSKSDSISDDIYNNNNQIKKAEKEIEFFNQQIQIQKEIYQNEVKLSQSKFCDRQKSLLKNDIHYKMLEIGEKGSTVSYLTEYIRKVFSQNEIMIEDIGIEELRKALSGQKAEYERLISENTDSLEKRYQINESDLKVIRLIYNDIA
ncbi:MAG: dynamin family protein [Oscillospiraceae bacterium]|nr:dynamin family protein [Oscillospiraceae bacterium]